MSNRRPALPERQRVEIKMNERATGMSKPRSVYEIRLDGHLEESWLDWFEGLTLTNEADGEAVLVLPAGDQALLHGVLARIRDLNLELIAVCRRDTPRLPPRKTMGKVE